MNYPNPQPPNPKEIPREVPCPRLIPRVTQLLTELCFSPDRGIVSPGDDQFDALLVLGVSRPVTQRMCADKVSMICLAHRPSIVYITGGGATGLSKGGPTEASLIHWWMDKMSIAGIDIVLEGMSVCTRTNVTCALDLGLRRYKRIAFVCKAGHYGRMILTLRKYVASGTVIVAGYEYSFPVDDGRVSDLFMLSKSTWMRDRRCRDRMWGEFLRIREYGERGDIDYPDSVRGVVIEILQLTGTA
ncbi:hypothetical protein EB052_01715 [bacterium]|nr:hypothetical protein [bacterium]